MIKDYAFNFVAKDDKKKLINIYLKLFIFINTIINMRQLVLVLNHKICIQSTSR
jgi:hypothetical protein